LEALKVAAETNPKSLAGAIVEEVKEKGGVEVRAIGARAVNQGVKAIAIARGYIASSGIELICIPAFTDTEIEGEERTVLKLIVEAR